MSRIATGSTGICQSPDRALSLRHRPRPERLDQLIRQPVRRVQAKLLTYFLVLVDGTAVHAGKLRGARDDRAQYGFQVERRTDGLADFAQCLQFSYRLRELGRARLKFLEEPNVLDRDHRLIGEGLQQSDLFFGKRARDAPADSDGAHGLVLAHQRNAQYASETPLRKTLQRKVWIQMRIVNGGDAARQHGPAGCGTTIKRPRPKSLTASIPSGLVSAIAISGATRRQT